MESNGQERDQWADEANCYGVIVTRRIKYETKAMENLYVWGAKI